MRSALATRIVGDRLLVSFWGIGGISAKQRWDVKDNLWMAGTQPIYRQVDVIDAIGIMLRPAAALLLQIPTTRMSSGTTTPSEIHLVSNQTLMGIVGYSEPPPNPTPTETGTFAELRQSSSERVLFFTLLLQ
ncbi:hypothetical protein BD779DRAFT_1506723 [Infundibulicybe gibba]|nr:hypothetical protein BD779DRAFT_1506723 [Infundibulicybe gibba]